MTVSQDKGAARTTAATPPDHLNTQFERDGYVICPPLFTADFVHRVNEHIDLLLAGKAETGIAPMTYNPERNRVDPTALVKMDQTHLSDRTVYELVTHPALGRWAAAVTGAQKIWVWATQLLVKPPGGKDSGNVGWHQDWHYWAPWFKPESEIFTAWVAMTDVKEDCGPMLFAHGSNRWGSLGQGHFFDSDIDAQKRAMALPPGESWREVPAVMPPGAMSFHHRYTFHGSGPNRSGHARRSFAIHLRTEKSWGRTDSEDYYPKILDNEHDCPLIFSS